MNPYIGASSATYFVEEVTPNVTPTSPAWTKLRNTGGMPTITKDTLQSEELDESREIKSVRTGNESVSGEFSTELSFGSHDALYENAMSSDFVAGEDVAGIEVTVDEALKTFTRTAGDFLADGFLVGDLVDMPSLTDNNSNPFIATAVSALVITGAAITVTLSPEVVTTNVRSGDKLGTGNLCKTMSIMTHLKGKCGTVDNYIVTTGVEMTGWSLDVSVNATVTGSFPIIGRNQEEGSLTPPAGSTFNPDTTTRPYASVDGKVVESGELQAGVTSIAYTNDNNTSPQFELGSKAVSFVERGTANNSLSATVFMEDTELLNKFINETIVDVGVILNHPDGGAMSFSTPQTVLTEVTPELSSGSVTQSVAGMAIGDANNSSMVIQRLT